jgi:ABC-2 type transport system ATP-binding protein
LTAIIQVEKLCKNFTVYKHYRGNFSVFKNFMTRESRLIKAVDQVCFQIKPGEIVGYLGPNGAGKSTTIKMLTGLLVPTSGSLSVNGYLPWRDRRKYVRRIGAVFGQRTTLWWDLPVIESFELLRHIYDIPMAKYKANLNEFNRILNLDEFLDIPVRLLSLGQRMRADLCAALLHEPELVFLDEPTIGLDVVAKEKIRQFILHINQKKAVTVLLTTHDLSDVERLCNRIMIIDQGRLLYDGDLDRLVDRFGGKRSLVVDFAEPYPTIEIQDSEVISIENQRITLQFNRNQVTASELISRLAQKYRIRDLQVLEPKIEDTIRKIYEERLLERGASADPSVLPGKWD